MTVDHLYALSRLFKFPINDILVLQEISEGGNANIPNVRMMQFSMATPVIAMTGL